MGETNGSTAVEAGKASIFGLLFLFFLFSFVILLLVPDPLPVIDELILFILTIASANSTQNSIENASTNYNLSKQKPNKVSTDKYGQLKE